MLNVENLRESSALELWIKIWEANGTLEMSEILIVSGIIAIRMRMNEIEVQLGNEPRWR